MTKKLSSSSLGPVTRVLDAVDRGHARAADRAHAARNVLRAALERVLDRAETLLATARTRVTRVDAATADAIIRAQGAVGKAIEKARHARTLPQHLTS